MGYFIIMWTDRENEPRVRLLEGSDSDAAQACELLRQKYEASEGFEHAHIVEVLGPAFVGLEIIESEFEQR